MALRGHASIQGSTDIPTLFDLLPGYLPMPHAYGNEDLDDLRGRPSRCRRGSGPTCASYMVSLLKAWWGDAATAENDYCFDYLPRLTGRPLAPTRRCSPMLDGDAARATSCSGQNPAVGLGQLQACSALGMAKLDWLVVRDMVMIESADVLEGRPGDRDR